MDRLIFRSPRGDFAVVRLLLEPDHRPAMTVGRFPPVRVGERLHVRGHWQQNPQHGLQLELDECLLIVPETLSALQKLLTSGVVEGIGPVLAERLVSRQGENLLTLLTHLSEPDTSPACLSARQTLRAVSGMTARKVERLEAFWRTLKQERTGRLFLASLEIPVGLADRIQRRYGEQTEAVVRDNPYLLAEELKGVGFARADEIALKLGLTPDSPARAKAATLFLLNRALEEGHVYLPQQKLLEQAEALGISPANFLRGLSQLEADASVTVEGMAGQYEGEIRERAVYLTSYFELEKKVAERLAQLKLDPATSWQSLEISTLMPEIEAALGLSLASAQKDALLAGLSAPLLILSGGPGTGKTTLVRGLLWLYARAGLTVALAAPTGRAARRLQDASGQEASTLHRLLEVQMPGMRFQRDRRNPLEAQVVLVDEASMIDLPLFSALLEALPKGARLVLVGDAQQLPPVGPGNVLEALMNVSRALAEADMGAEPPIKCVVLEQVHRQGQQSLIALNALRIQRGLLPQLARGVEAPSADFFFVEASDAESVLQRLVELMSRRLPQHYGFDPRRDIQVLSPSQKGALGVQALNPVLQAALNPPSPSARNGGQRLRFGDKVLQARNNYDRELFNGDLGFVVGEGGGRPPELAATEGVAQVPVGGAAGPWGTEAQLEGASEPLSVLSPQPTSEAAEPGGLWVQFDQKQVLLSAAEVGDLELAYAMTVHKSQGSEFPAVVLPLLESHATMLRRNLFYTAVTRARKLLVIVGSWEAVTRAVRNDYRDQRFGALAERLCRRLMG